jgi:hypothetical protein
MSQAEAQRRHFTADEVGELIDLAARLDELTDESSGLSYDELVRVADEVGISRSAIEKAVRQDRSARRRLAKEGRKRVRRRMRFIRHATVFAVVVSALILIDVLNGGGWWFFYVAALWGAVLALQGLRFLTRKSGPVEEALISRQVAATPDP